MRLLYKIIKYYKSKLQHRITNGICSPPCSGGSGCEKPQSASPLCGFLSATFQPTANLRFALKGGLERHIPRTLCEIGAKLVEKLLNMDIDKIV